MNHQTAELSIAIKKIDNAPGEGDAGSPAYQVRIAIVGLKKKKRWHSATVPAPNPVINETAVFKNMTPDELAKAALRFRLYGCKKMRRHYIYAESTIAFPVLNLHGGEADIPVALQSKVGHESVVDSDSDSGDNLSRLHASGNMGSRLSMRSSASKHSSISRFSHRRTPTPVGATSAAESVQPELDIARQVAEGREANWPELQCGIAYNITTKRLQVSVLRANRLRIPDASLRTPKAAVSVSLLSSTGEKITSSQTHDVKLSSCTEFGEKFAFDLSSLDPRELTVFFRVLQKRHVHKDEVLGWFALGSRNTGEEERNHWNEMLQAQGQEITRWHVLNENVT